MATAELGQAIHRWRDRISPGDAGLPSGGRRRTAGLRREELAQLAGISVDYVMRLEQGRATNPSSQVVEALARALRLAAVERDHLYRLAGLAPPSPKLVPSFIPPSVQRLLDRLAGTPVVVCDATWTLLVANPPYTALMSGSDQWHGPELNGVWRNFLGQSDYGIEYTPAARSAFEAALVADLRIMVYTAEPGTEDAERLALLTVVGTQELRAAP